MQPIKLQRLCGIVTEYDVEVGIAVEFQQARAANGGATVARDVAMQNHIAAIGPETAIIL